MVLTFLCMTVFPISEDEINKLVPIEITCFNGCHCSRKFDVNHRISCVLNFLLIRRPCRFWEYLELSN